MSKKTAALIGLCVLLVFLCACTGKSYHSGSSNTKGGEGSVSESGRVSISVSLWGNTARNEGIFKTAESYEDDHNTEISVYCLEWNDYWPGLAVSAAGHVLPDLIQMDYFYLNQFSEKNLLTDLTPFIEKGVLEVRGDEQLFITDQTDERVYGIAEGVVSPALFYNKNLLKDIGISLSDRLSMDEFLAVSKQVYESTGYKTNIAFGIEGFLEYFCRGYGEILYEEDKIGASRQTLEKYFELYEEGISEGWLISPGVFSDITIGSVEQDPLVYGKEPEVSSWCDFGYSFQIRALADAAPSGMEIGITSWPSRDTEQSAYLRPGPFFTVSQDCEHPEEAIGFLNYILKEAEDPDLLYGTQGIPVTLLTDENGEEPEDPYNRMAACFIRDVVLPYSSPINPAPPAWAGEAYNLNGSLVEKVCYGELSAKEAADEMLAKGNSISKE